MAEQIRGPGAQPSDRAREIHEMLQQGPKPAAVRGPEAPRAPRTYPSELFGVMQDKAHEMSEAESYDDFRAKHLDKFPEFGHLHPGFMSYSSHDRARDKQLRFDFRARYLHLADKQMKKLMENLPPEAKAQVVKDGSGFAFWKLLTDDPDAFRELTEGDERIQQLMKEVEAFMGFRPTVRSTRNLPGPTYGSGKNEG